MNGVIKERLATVLLKLQHRHCSYYHHGSSEDDGKIHFCDCKYVGEGEPIRPGSESGPGCCELALAYTLINAMTPQEYIRLCRRAGVWVSALPETYKPVKRKKVPVNPLARVDKTTRGW